MRLFNALRIAAFCGLGLLLQNIAIAAVSVTPVTPYSTDTNKIVAYAGRVDWTTGQDPLTGGFAPAFSAAPKMDTGYTFFNLNDGYSTSATPSTANMILFDVTVSGLTANAGQAIYVVAGADPSPDTSIVPFAAASVGLSGTSLPVPCSTTNLDCKFEDASAPRHYWLGARITTGNTIRIGIYPADICAKTTGAITTLCTGTSVKSPSAASAVLLAASLAKITFYAYVSSDSDTVRQTAVTGTVSDYVNAQFYGVALDVYGASGSATAGSACSAFATAPYFPGDGEISVDAGSVKVIASTGSMAQAEALVVVGGEALAAQTPSNFSSATIVSRIPVTGSTTVGGFINTDPSGSSTHNYTLYFAYRDRTGMVGPFSCFTTNNVKTAQILGFLKKNSCFIATGAFRSESDLPVRVLRDFRDHFLNRFELGRQFRDWYYRWSPSAGWWLLENPQFRFPILRLLLPLQILALAVLHPFGFVLFVTSVVGIGFFMTARRNRRSIREMRGHV